MINEFKTGLKIDQIVLLRLQKVGNSSNGGVFARGLIEDNSGCVPFICFEAGIVEKLRAFDAPKAVRVAGNVDINKFAGDMSLQLIIQKLADVKAGEVISHLLPQGNFDKVEYEERFQKQINSINDKGLRELVKEVFSGSAYQQFLINPAGMRLHHAYVGGLLHHSVCVADLACALADKIGGMDKDLVLAGALLHDVGKLKEISPDMGFPYTTGGRLLGHITITVMMVSEAAAKLGSVDEKKLQQLLHIILSHHGEQDKGSPVACATKEGFVVHYADEIDAIMNQFDVNNTEGTWEFNKMLQRYLYL